MKEPLIECWVDVPQTGARVQVSNFAHLRVVGKKRCFVGKVLCLHVNELKNLICDYKSGELGWYVFFDRKNHFFPRDELMSLFPTSLVEIDHSVDQEAIKFKEKTWQDLKAKGVVE